MVRTESRPIVREMQELETHRFGRPSRLARALPLQFRGSLGEDEVPRHLPEAMMLAYNLSPRDLDGLIEYLTAMPGPWSARLSLLQV